MFDLESVEFRKVVADECDMTLRGVNKMHKEYPKRYLRMALGVFASQVEFDELLVMVNAVQQVKVLQTQKRVRGLI